MIIVQAMGRGKVYQAWLRKVRIGINPIKRMVGKGPVPESVLTKSAARTVEISSVKG